MRKHCMSIISLILVVMLLAGNLCMTVSAATSKATVFDKVSTFPSSPFEFYTRLSMINNALPDPFRLELEDSPSDWIDITIFRGDDRLFSMDFDRITTWSDGSSIRETMSGDKLLEKCDYINTHPLFKGEMMDDRYLEQDVLEALLLIEMACDPQTKRVEDADEVYAMIQKTIDTGDTQERNGIAMMLDCYASYGVMLTLRDAKTQELPPTHH